jgi:hypothetical protein
MTAGDKFLFLAIGFTGLAMGLRFWLIIRAEEKARQAERRVRLSEPDDPEIDFMAALRPLGRVPAVDEEMRVYRNDRERAA